MSNNKYYIPYFTHQELACKATDIVKLAPGFAENLNHSEKNGISQ